MSISEMEAAMDQAKAELRRADACADAMARMLIGRLRKITSYNTLKRLKAELQSYNAHTCQWKEER